MYHASCPSSHPAAHMHACVCLTHFTYLSVGLATPPLAMTLMQCAPRRSSSRAARRTCSSGMQVRGAAGLLWSCAERQSALNQAQVSITQRLRMVWLRLSPRAAVPYQILPRRPRHTRGRCPSAQRHMRTAPRRARACRRARPSDSARGLHACRRAGRHSHACVPACAAAGRLLALAGAS